ncbi:MAG TPA: hypothetical protein VFE53_05125 [Mucilaginibacter sp.]|jgi:iron complex transport system substrate-binding protein|nr:hypothetical protein [Mucilaginibacter sp.]
MADTLTPLIDALLTAEESSTQEALRERIDIVRHKLKFSENKPVVACIENLEPLTISGDLLAEAIAIAGGIPVLAHPAQNSTATNWEWVGAADPDLIIIALRGLTIEDTLKELPDLLELADFSALKAVKNNRFYIADGRQFYAPGAGIVNAIEMLAEMIHPKQFVFGYEGPGWMQFST